jgi:hypothetical protein
MLSSEDVGGNDQNSSQLSPFDLVRCPITGRNGKAIHNSTWIRWATKGVRLSNGSRLRLRALKSPGGWRCCEAWAQEFFDALTADRLGIAADDAPAPNAPTAKAPTPPLRRRTARERAEASRRAGALLESLGC